MKRSALLIFAAFGLLLYGWQDAYSQSSYSERRSRAEQRQLLYNKLPEFGPNNFPRYGREMYRGGIPVDFQASNFQFQGRINPFLSTACAQGNFNQQKVNRYIVTLRSFDSKFQKNVGFASSNGLNLRDPKNYAQPGFFYLFDLDGTSSCKVAIFNE